MPVMVRNQPQTPASPAYSYGQVETALATVFDIDATGQKGAFRGRVQHLRRLGLVADSPGRGRVIDYTQGDADKWLVALELEHFGLDPVRVVDLVKRNWNPPPERKRSASEAFARGEACLADLVFEARGSRRPESDVILTIRFETISALPDVGYTMAGGMRSFAGWLADDHAARRASVFNLSARLRALDAALVEAAKPQPPTPSGMAKRILGAGKRRRGQG
jgi:hypothetical protein